MHWSAEVVAEVSRSLRETSEARVTSDVRSHPSPAFAARRLAHLGQPGSSDGGGPRAQIQRPRSKLGKDKRFGSRSLAHLPSGDLFLAPKMVGHRVAAPGDRLRARLGRKGRAIIPPSAKATCIREGRGRKSAASPPQLKARPHPGLFQPYGLEPGGSGFRQTIAASGL